MKKARFKRSKMGKLPGELSIRTKARMMESNEPIDVSPWQRIGTRAIKIFRKFQQRRAEVRFRRGERAEIEEEKRHDGRS